MEIKDAVKILKQHNEWRRGNTDNDEMVISAKTIGVAIDTLTEHFERNVILDDVSSYYFLVDGDEVRFGDEYYDCDEVNGWVEVELSYRFDYVSEEMYKMRRKK